MKKEVRTRTITRRMEAVIDGLDDSLDKLITKGDIESVLEKLVCVGNKSNRPSVLRVLFEMLDATGIEYEKGKDNQYYIDLINSCEFPDFQQIEEKFIYILYSVYKNYLSPEDYMLRIVDKLSIDNWNEDTLRIRILKQFIKYGNYLSDAKYGGKKYVQDYIKNKCGTKKINEEIVLSELDDDIFEVLEKAEKQQKKPEGKFGLLKLCDDLANGKFRTGGATKKGLYLFAFVFNMTYYAGEKEFDKSLYDTDIELNLFSDYYMNNLMRFVSDAYNGKLCEYELDPSGQGINYKNFAEMVYIYYLSSPYSIESKIKKSSEMIDRIVKSEEQGASSKFIDSKTIHYKSLFYKNEEVFSDDLLKMPEDVFEQYLIENFLHNTLVTDEKTGKVHNIGPMQLEAEQNTAFSVYKQLLDDMLYEGIKLENCNYGLWFADVAELKMNGIDRIVKKYNIINHEDFEEFINLLLGVNSFLGYTVNEKESSQNTDQEYSKISKIKTKALYVTDAAKISRTSLIVAYYYYYNAVNLDSEAINRFRDCFLDFKQSVDELLYEAGYQPFSGKNIFDVLVAFSSYAYLNE